MATITVPVNEKHIETSDKGDPNSCMIANAIREQLDLPQSVRVWVNSGTDMGLDSRGGVIRFKAKNNTKGEITKRIQAFDEQEPVEPFKVEFELPDDWRERIVK